MKVAISFLSIVLLSSGLVAQDLWDDFEGNGTVNSWFADDCSLHNEFANPYSQSINTSSTVLKYEDVGGTWANVRFDAYETFDLSTGHVFSLLIYVESSSITGSSPNQVSLKLQNADLNEPWATQTEIIKSIVLDQWQEVTFDFVNDNFVNLDVNSPDPIDRTDFNRVLIQVNGENNNDFVTAYIDDFSFDGDMAIPAPDPVYDMLVWSDEFDGDGAIDTSKWFHQTQLPNGVSWYNNEVQHYTNREENASVANGNLSITAIKESFTDQGQTKEYTSARLNSKFAFQNGRVEVRAKLPTGVGTWPAIWTLGKNIIEPGGYWTESHGTVSWPACGEIDIMEHWGSNQNYVQSALHTPSSYGATVNHGGLVNPTASDAFHIYELVWTPEKMEFSLDGSVFYTYAPEMKTMDNWPYTAEQYILLNVAMLEPTASNFESSAMVIDYVRIYQEDTTEVVGMDEVNVQNRPTVYPNPVHDKLHIEVSDEWIGADVKLYTSLGQVVGHYIQAKGKQSYDLSVLPSGMYFIQFTIGAQSTTQRLVKE